MQIYSRKRLAKNLMATLSAGCLAFSLTACGGAPANGTKTPDSGSGQQVDAQAEAKKIAESPAEVVFLGGGYSEELFNNRFGNQIRKKFPNYKITLLSGNIADIVATAPAIDIVISSGTGMSTTVLQHGLESDISDLVAKYKYDLSKIESAPLDELRKLMNGKLPALPWTVATQVFYYNKDVFDKFGVPYPKDDLTWDQVYDMAKTMTRSEGGVQYRGITFGVFNQAIGWNQLGAPFFDTTTFKAKFTDDVFKRVFQNVTRFLDINGNQPRDGSGKAISARNVFLNEHSTAMHVDGSGVVTMLAQTNANWDIARFPDFPGQAGVGPSVNPDYLFISSKSKSRDAAFQILSYIASDEYQGWSASTYGLLPILTKKDDIMKNFGTNIAGLSGKNVSGMVPKRFATMQPFTPFTGIANKEIDKAIQEYMGGKDVNTVLREAAERVDKQVEAQQQK
ncbi:ABC transporter substrate-binding protein [Paenibacillus oceani]|uniref:Extracellular solute-binding protein n=1 Tax=Paenibacillus oceani TaxID=2772510 RepID=A0A927H200_9BACL|nr:extracellular solute-binding protein [Paenibacillus oceani]MBD2865726.1 extracellular solute-binding protein [Paenibacillus oceani]